MRGINVTLTVLYAYALVITKKFMSEFYIMLVFIFSVNRNN